MSRVILVLLCPSRSLTALMGVPAARSKVACVCGRSLLLLGGQSSHYGPASSPGGSHAQVGDAWRPDDPAAAPRPDATGGALRLNRPCLFSTPAGDDADAHAVGKVPTLRRDLDPFTAGNGAELPYAVRRSAEGALAARLARVAGLLDQVADAADDLAA